MPIAAIERSRFAVLPVEALRLAPEAVRQRHADDRVAALAEAIRQHGYDPSCPVSIVPAPDGGVEVLAGGARVLAAREAGLDRVPCIVYPADMSPEERVRVAHASGTGGDLARPIPPPQVWAAYARLHDQGWSVRRIAGAVGVDHATVGRRLQYHRLYTTAPEDVRRAIDAGRLTEGHLTVALPTRRLTGLPPWLAAGGPLVLALRRILQQQGRTGGTGIRAALAAADADPGLPAALAAAGVTTLAGVEAVIRTRRGLAGAEDGVRWLYGDARNLLRGYNGPPIRCILTDPPYGMDHRPYRARSRALRRTEPIAGDGSPEEADALLAEVLAMAVPLLAADAHVWIFCRNTVDHPGRVAAIQLDAGLDVDKQVVVWDRGRPGQGDTETEVAPQAEAIVHAYRGRPALRPRLPQILKCEPTHESRHPHEKPVALLRQIIEASTLPGDVVLDPFGGSASTVVAAVQAGRRAWGCEIDPGYWEDGWGRIARARRPLLLDGDVASQGAGVLEGCAEPVGGPALR
ncbi:MAG: ParB N-terminal domain-containing protein [Actinomycetia bacterium]|nr:ParB N-terminal domain-containing protein [Actinomycetes bacterium]